MLLSYTIVDFHLSWYTNMIYKLIYKYEHLWLEVSVKSLILRWPLRPVGLLLSIVLHNLPLVATNLFPFFLDYAVVKGDASVSEIKFSMRTKIRALVRVLWEQKSWKTNSGSRGIGISVADTGMETIVTISLMTQNGHLFLKCLLSSLPWLI